MKHFLHVTEFYRPVYLETTHYKIRGELESSIVFNKKAPLPVLNLETKFTIRKKFTDMPT